MVKKYPLLLLCYDHPFGMGTLIMMPREQKMSRPEFKIPFYGR